jgi:hypothetical protein
MDKRRVVRAALPVPDPYAVRDNGRRGEPLPGCDCMRCFGMCLIDPDMAYRDIVNAAESDNSDFS